MSFDEPPFASHEDRPVGGEGAGPGADRSRWAVAVLAGVAVLVMAGVAAVVFGHFGGRGTPVGSPASGASVHASASKRLFGCAMILDPGTAPDTEYCKRMVDDAMRRTELTDADRTRLAADQKKAEQALHWPSMCNGIYAPVYPSTPQNPQCEGIPKRDPVAGSSSSSGGRRPDSMDARAIRISFDRAGFPGSVVRIAAGNDPAPKGSIVFGVPVKDACLVGFEYSLAGGGSYGLAGRLPDGRCLAE
jgi:hypothetical protein